MQDEEQCLEFMIHVQSTSVAAPRDLTRSIEAMYLAATKFAVARGMSCMLVNVVTVIRGVVQDNKRRPLKTLDWPTLHRFSHLQLLYNQS